jgi:hypothetical protein
LHELFYFFQKIGEYELARICKKIEKKCAGVDEEGAARDLRDEKGEK